MGATAIITGAAASGRGLQFGRKKKRDDLYPLLPAKAFHHQTIVGHAPQYPFLPAETFHLQAIVRHVPQKCQRMLWHERERTVWKEVVEINHVLDRVAGMLRMALVAGQMETEQEKEREKEKGLSQQRVLQTSN